MKKIYCYLFCALLFTTSLYALDDKAKQALIQKAESGDPVAQNNLAVCYMFGTDGFPEDKQKGVELYRKSAEQGFPKGMLNLGILSKNGDGTPQDYKEAMKWFLKVAEVPESRFPSKKAAQQDLSWAENNIGSLYRRGLGVEKNPEEAIKWYRKSASRNDRVAEKNLGICYLQGIGVQKDESEAAKWFTKAADKGEPRSQFYLAECYERGQGVKSDPEIAFSWMKKAAEQNYAQAEVKLATYYANGIGTKQDLAESIKLYQKGSKKLIEILQDINPRD
jgi:TPR repeat protein